MNLLLRGFESKEVAENVAAEILKRGVAKSAKVDVPDGDLGAAQRCLAGIWPFLNMLEQGETKELVIQLKKDLLTDYNLAMANT